MQRLVDNAADVEKIILPKFVIYGIVLKKGRKEKNSTL